MIKKEQTWTTVANKKLKKMKKSLRKKIKKERTWTTVASILTVLSFASDGAVHLGFGRFLVLVLALDV